MANDSEWTSVIGELKVAKRVSGIICLVSVFISKSIDSIISVG